MAKNIFQRISNSIASSLWQKVAISAFIVFVGLVAYRFVYPTPIKFTKEGQEERGFVDRTADTLRRKASLMPKYDTSAIEELTGWEKVTTYFADNSYMPIVVAVVTLIVTYYFYHYGIKNAVHYSSTYWINNNNGFPPIRQKETLSPSNETQPMTVNQDERM